MSKIVLFPLSVWATSHLKDLLESKTVDDFNTAFDATFDADCTFTVNGDTIERDDYRAQLLAQSAASFGESATTVTIKDSTQVEVGDQGQLSGVVGIFYMVVSESKFLILGVPTQRRDTSSINLSINPTKENPQNPNIPIHGFFDPRMVTSVNQVVSETTYHATIPQSAVPKTATLLEAPGPVIPGKSKYALVSN